MNEYTNQANKFLTETRTRLDVNYIKTGQHFKGDKEDRDIYQFTLSNEQGIYSAQFGDSIKNTQDRRKCHADRDMVARKPTKGKISPMSKGFDWEIPNSYDILSCLTGYDPENFEEFCASYGYDNDSISALEIYKKVQAEYDGLKAMFSPEQLDQLNEIQ